MLNKLLARYLFDNYFQLVMPEYLREYEKLKNNNAPDIQSRRQQREDILAFEIKMAEKILEEYAFDIIINRCPKCQQLARTPHARQCPHCFHTWHDQPASFKVNHAMKIKGKGFYIVGKHLFGIIKPGMKMIFSPIGINKIIIISSFEFVLNPRGLKNVEETALEIKGLSESEEKELSLNCPYLIPIAVIE